MHIFYINIAAANFGQEVNVKFYENTYKLQNHGRTVLFSCSEVRFFPISEIQTKDKKIQY